MLKQKLSRTLIFVLAAVMLAGVSQVAVPTHSAWANTETELKNKTKQLEAEIAANQAVLHNLEHEVSTLQGRIGQIQAEIDQANREIELTTLKIQELEASIIATQAELDRQKEILASALQQLYKRGDVTTIELLAASDNYTEFIDQQEYLERLKVGVQDSADKVQALKDQLESERKLQQEQLERQESQRKVLAEKRAEEQELLTATQGEEARYADIVANLQEQRKQAEQALINIIASKKFVSQGTVSSGWVIGKVGSSGFSTGPHLHFAVMQGTSFQNPVAGGQSLVHGFLWPLPNSDWGDVTQSYGCVAPYDWYSTKCDNGKSFHSGLDISGWYGDPVTAAAPGEIVYRGWLSGYGNTVIIHHGGGLYTYYPHLLE